jgi:antitoxin CptB
MLALMELGDNDLLDLHLTRRTLAQVDAGLDCEDVREVLCMLRKPLER